LSRVTQRSNAHRANHDSILSDQSKRALATAAVKASIHACNVAVTKALRDADVIWATTFTGAADPRLLAACSGHLRRRSDMAHEDKWKDSTENKKPKVGASRRTATTHWEGVRFAPDGLAPLSLPFVLVDEACRSVEPATLIPLIASNSCRSLVLLGDPCRFPTDQ
jgi:hypothetical protein